MKGKKKADYSFSFLWKFCFGILFLFRVFPQKPIPFSALDRKHFSVNFPEMCIIYSRQQVSWRFNIYLWKTWSGFSLSSRSIEF